MSNYSFICYKNNNMSLYILKTCVVCLGEKSNHTGSREGLIRCVKETILWKSMPVFWPHDKLLIGVVEEYINLMDIKCCKANNSIIHLLQSDSSLITQRRKLKIRPVICWFVFQI